MSENVVSSEAVEAAARAWLGVKPGAAFDMDAFRKSYPHAAIERALTAALPFLLRPVVREGGEQR